MPLSDIVNVQITRQTSSVSRAGFSTILVLGPNANFSERLQFVSDLAALAALLTGGTAAPEYQAATLIFSQNPKVSQIAVGNLTANKVITDNAGTYTAGAIGATVNGHVISTAYNTNKDTTLTDFAAAIQALTEIQTATYVALSHTITIVPATGYQVEIELNTGSVTGTMTMALSSVATEDWDTALTAIKNYNNDWYGIVAVTHAEADVLDVAAWAEANDKLFATSSQDSEIVDTSLAGDTGSIAKQLNALGYVRTALVYHDDADADFPEAGLLGRILPLDPGSYTAMFKTLAGVSAVTLTTTQENNAREKFCNIYHEIGGRTILRDGWVVGEEFIDVIVFIDWLDARLTEDVYQLLTSQLKVPFTDAGIAAIDAVVKKRLQIGQNRGGISPTAFDADNNQIGGFVTVVPKLENVPAIDRAARELNDVTFTAWLAGAIHAVSINGVVTV